MIVVMVISKMMEMIMREVTDDGRGVDETYGSDTGDIEDEGDEMTMMRVVDRDINTNNGRRW